MYGTSIRLISGYVARKYENCDEIKTILNKLKMTTLEKPKALDSGADAVDKEIYKEDAKAYAKENRVLTRSAKKLYPLVLGQCTESLGEKTKVIDNWKNMDDGSDSVEFIKKIREIEFKVETGKNIYITTWRIKRDTTNHFQNKDTPKRYLDKFLSNAQVVNQRDCGIWLDDGTVMVELKISKGATITWDLVDQKDIENARGVATKKMQAMEFFNSQD